MSAFKANIKKITEGPFFTFSKLPLEFFEKKKLFKLIFDFMCVLCAIVSLIYPLVILFRTISTGYFNFGFRYALAFILIWLSVVAAGWLGFHLWRNKRKITAEFGTSEFIVLPFFSEIIKTFGEWMGMLYGVIGAVGGLFALIFLGRYSVDTLTALLVGSDSVGDLIKAFPIFGGLFESLHEVPVIGGPIIGIILIFITRFFAEGMMVVAVIANNTKETVSELRGNANKRVELAPKRPEQPQSAPQSAPYQQNDVGTREGYPSAENAQ